ncbi:MAG: MobP2 family relaxase [Anaerovoracaceae bacterium]
MVGIVAVTEFCSSSDSAFSGYIDYIDRDEATRTEHINDFNILGGYMDYMENPEKSTGLFSEKTEELTDEDKKEYKEAFKTAKANGSLMWQTVISFDNAWLKDMGIWNPETKALDEGKLQLATRSSVSTMLEKENLQAAVWTAATHYNTDNFHVHIAIVEPLPMREKREYQQYEKEKVAGKWRYKKQLSEKTGRYEKIAKLDAKGELILKEEYVGKFKESSIKALKSEMVKELSFNKEMNAEINSLIRDRIIKDAKENALFYDPEFKGKLLELYEKLPKDVTTNLWGYNTNAVEPIRPLIDEISDKYIAKHHEGALKSLESLLDRQEAVYQVAYGKDNSFKENKLNDLHARLGNTILNELKLYHKEKESLGHNKSSEMVAKKGTRSKQEFKSIANKAERDLKTSMKYLKRSLQKEASAWINKQEYELLQAGIQGAKNINEQEV